MGVSHEIQHGLPPPTLYLDGDDHVTVRNDSACTTMHEVQTIFRHSPNK